MKSDFPFSLLLVETTAHGGECLVLVCRSGEWLFYSRFELMGREAFRVQVMWLPWRLGESSLSSEATRSALEVPFLLGHAPVSGLTTVGWCFWRKRVERGGDMVDVVVYGL